MLFIFVSAAIFFVSHVVAMPVPIAHYDGKGALNMRLNRAQFSLLIAHDDSESTYDMHILSVQTLSVFLS